VFAGLATFIPLLSFCVNSQLSDEIVFLGRQTTWLAVMNVSDSATGDWGRKQPRRKWFWARESSR